MIMTMPEKPKQPRRPRLSPRLERMRRIRKAPRAEAGPESIVLHMPASKKPGGTDLSLAAMVLFIIGLAFYAAGKMPAHREPPEEILEMAESPPPPVDVKEPPKPPPPPPERAAPPAARMEAPPPVFGLQQDETSEEGDMASATGNTLATAPEAIVQKAPAPLYSEPVELDRAPAFLKQVMAEYPEWAQDQGVEAVVLVWVTIDADGRVTNAAVKRGAGKDFDAGALEAARASLFQPLVKDGARLPSRFVVTYDFKLES
ncbi:MAG: ligand-gated channel protein [Fibrobacteres bacterium]|nr:ligand-gated channel protein [Fibrobacterota bacterium]